jgi:hypothetical protein
VHVACDVIHITLMEWSLKQVEQTPGDTPAFEPASPGGHQNILVKSRSDGLEHPLQAVTGAVRLALEMHDS